MGWKGDGYGLGKFEQGITRPLELDVNRCRLGFGFARFGDGYDDELLELDQKDQASILPVVNQASNNCQANNSRRVQNFRMKPKTSGFINNIVNLLSNFISSPTENDLIFSNNLSVEDRKFVHGGKMV